MSARAADNRVPAALHLIKWSVEIETFEHLAEVQAKRAGAPGGLPLRHLTRHAPRRSAEITSGGSIYWIIKGIVRARQRIVAIAEARRDDGSPACAVVLDPVLVRTQGVPWRAFQGWRYLEHERAPGDLAGPGPGADLPAALAAELRTLGLI